MVDSDKDTDKFSRLFIAVPLGERALHEVSTRISHLTRKRWSVRWEEEEKVHFTLFFLGKVEAKRINAVSSALREAVHNVEAFSIFLGSIGAFPDFYLPRIIWLVVKGDQQAFIRLRKRISHSMEQLGFGKETRGYIPHLTIGRVEHDLRFKGRRELGRQLAKYEIGKFLEKIVVDRVVLFQSQLQPHGSRYTVISEIPFS